MPEEPQEPEPTQYTPQGHEIPIPTREQVLRDFDKIAKSRKKPADPESEGGTSGPEEE